MDRQTEVWSALHGSGSSQLLPPVKSCWKNRKVLHSLETLQNWLCSHLSTSCLLRRVQCIAGSRRDYYKLSISQKYKRMVSNTIWYNWLLVIISDTNPEIFSNYSKNFWLYALNGVWFHLIIPINGKSDWNLIRDLRISWTRPECPIVTKD